MAFANPFGGGGGGGIGGGGFAPANNFAANAGAGGAFLGGANNNVLGRNNAPLRPLAPLGAAEEQLLLTNARQARDGGTSGAAQRRRKDPFRDQPVGVRKEPTASDFQELLTQSEGLLSKAPRRILPLRRALPDTVLASQKFEAEQRTRAFMDRRAAGGTDESGNVRSVQQSRNRAKKLLSEHQIDVEKHEQAINLVHLSGRPSVLDPMYDAVDVETYLDDYHDMIIKTAVQESINQTLAECNQRVCQRFEKDWEEMRDDLITQGHLRSHAMSRSLLQDAGEGPEIFDDEEEDDAGGAGGGGGETAPDGGGYAFLRSLDIPIEGYQPMLRFAADQRSALVAYSNEVRRYHSEVGRGRDNTQYNLATRFEIAASTCNETDDDIKKIKEDAWLLLRHYMNEHETRDELGPEGDPDLYRKRFFRGSGDPNSPPAYGEREGPSEALRLHFARCAVTFLEQQFTTIQVDHMNVQTGGGGDIAIPANDRGRSGLAPIQHILSHIEGRDGVQLGVEERFWMKVYYCLRCGEPQGRSLALELVRQYRPQNQSSAENGLKDKVELALQQWCKCFDPETPGHLQAMPAWAQALSNAAMQDTQRGTFKHAVLVLLAQSGGGLSGSDDGGRRLQGLSLPGAQVEDYMWQRLAIAIATQGLDQTRSRYTVEDLAARILGLGPLYFSPNHENPMLYFFVLLLAQEFERACDYLAAQHREMDAVHFAMTFYHYGALQLRASPVDATGAVSTGPGGRPRRPAVEGYGLCRYNSKAFAFHKLLDSYVRKFWLVWPGRAADYFAMLQNEHSTLKDSELGAGGSGAASSSSSAPEAWKDSWRRHYLTQLVLVTRPHKHLSILVGDPGGQARHSVLNKLLGDTKADDCICGAAQLATQGGEADIAIELYRRARRFNPAMRLLNKELSCSLQPHAEPSRRDAVEALATAFARQHLIDPNVSPDYVDDTAIAGGEPAKRAFRTEKKTLRTQLILAKFFKCTRGGNHAAARDSAQRTMLVDLDGQRTNNHLQDMIRQAFLELDENLQDIYGTFVVEYMRCLYELFAEVRRNQGAMQRLDTDPSSVVGSIRKEASVLLAHAIAIQGKAMELFYITDHQIKQIMEYEANMK